MFNPYFGTGNLDTAKKCIADNLRNYVKADAATNPANFNLYNALKNLVGAVEELKNTVSQLESDLSRARRDLEELRERLRR